MKGDDFVSQSHANAVTFLSGGTSTVKELEDVALLFGSHAFARIGEGDADAGGLDGDQDIGSVVGRIITPEQP